MRISPELKKLIEKYRCVKDTVLSGKLNDAQSSALIRTVFTPAGCSGHFIQYRFGSLF